MYMDYTRQSLPTKHYLELLGASLCVFNSNNNFVIENILKYKTEDEKTNWHNLIDKTSGQIAEIIKLSLPNEYDDKLFNAFDSLVKKRNRIIHSFQITFKINENEEQILATKDKDNRQYVINEKFLLDFIKENEGLSDLLYEIRALKK